MKARRLTEKDHPVVKSWWEAHKWPAISRDLLPETGIIVESDRPIVAGWVYKTDSKMGWLEWIISNPETTKEERSQALDELLQVALSEARDLGLTVLFGALSHAGLIDRYKKHGFSETDTNVTLLIRNLGG